MKIRVVCRNFVECNQELLKKFNVISVYSSMSFCPVNVKVKNLLELKFDDITEPENGYILFNDSLAVKVKDYFEKITGSDKALLVHCDAGISRSGAIGLIANEYFNKFIEKNFNDNEYFEKMNRHIMPNSCVVRELKNCLWKTEEGK